MEINSDSLIKVFESNFNYEIVETDIGTAVKMDCYNAFLYSNITGAGYFDNPVWLFTPKGMLKLFYNAFNYKFVTGIFENTTLKNTPYRLSLAKAFIFDGDKYILPVEFDTELEFQCILKAYKKKLEGLNIPTTNFIIQRIEKSKKGNGMESFMEYLTCETFKRYGYIVENQIPLAHTVGSPDFGGYMTEEFINFLRNHKFLPHGFHIIELSLLRLFPERTIRFPSEVRQYDDAVVGEAKTSTNKMTGQLEKYLDTSLFSEGYEIHPAKITPDKPYFGLVTLDDSYRIKIVVPKQAYTDYQNVYNKEEYFIWLNNYMKYYMIANLTNDELNHFYHSKMRDKIGKPEDIILFVNNCSYEEILSMIRGGDA